MGLPLALDLEILRVILPGHTVSWFGLISNSNRLDAQGCSSATSGEPWMA
uniref:Uncharacterized protein n=1 Tax=Xenopus tropicalis TaxID=8364 RepID=A0A1B8XXV3_XENTR